jgi:hypothetical protein
MSQELLADLRPLIDDVPPAGLGPGPRPGVLSEAEVNRRVEAAFTRNGRPRRAELIRSLLLLWHDHLDASHDISQSEHSSDGSFVHGIMHRREPDYPNAKYWWRSTGDNPAFPALAAGVGAMHGVDAGLLDRILTDGCWDPFAFTDAVAAGIREPEDSPRHQSLRAVQKIETETLLRHLLD